MTLTPNKGKKYGVLVKYIANSKKKKVPVGGGGEEGGEESEYFGFKGSFEDEYSWRGWCMGRYWLVTVSI